MFKLKHLGLAAVLMLVAAGAMASNFRAADQVYLTAAGKVASFASDVWITNVSTADTVSVSVIYTPTGQGSQPQYFDNIITLRAMERKEIIDFFPTALGLSSGFGSLIFNACKQGADCINTQDSQGNSPNFRDIIVFSRIYSTQAGPPLTTSGQAFPGIPWYNFVSSRQAANGLGRVVIQGIRNTGTGSPRQPGTYRSNIGLMNASQYSTTTIVVKLFNGATNTQIGSDFTITLGPLNMVQSNVSGMFPAFGTGPTSTNAFVTVEQTNNVPTNDAPATCLPDGCPGFLAYGSGLDNQTDDPTTLESVYEKSLASITGALDIIYGSSATQGKTNLRRAVKLSH
ncbi:MAG TPA: hypothetical protein VGK31_04835 [Thermoanaerobaculia bacterium]|jgi:hypothetical protein